MDLARQLWGRLPFLGRVAGHWQRKSRAAVGKISDGIPATRMMDAAQSQVEFGKSRLHESTDEKMLEES